MAIRTYFSLIRGCQ